MKNQFKISFDEFHLLQIVARVLDQRLCDDEKLSDEIFFEICEKLDKLHATKKETT